MLSAQTTQLGPHRLQLLCAKLLVQLKDHLGDVGDTPQAVLEPVLAYCSAANLAAIERETRRGSTGGVSLHLDLAGLLTSAPAGLVGAPLTWT